MKKFKLIRESMLNEFGPAALTMPANHLAKFDPKPGLKFPSDKQIPQMIIFKRKAIRVYPDNQKVALYYSEQLDQFITIPFGGSVQFNEAANHKNTKLLPKSREEIRMDLLKKTKQKNSEKLTKTTNKMRQLHPYTDPIPSGWEGVGDVGARVAGLAVDGVFRAIKGTAGIVKAAGIGAKEGIKIGMERARKQNQKQVNETFDRHLRQIEENILLNIGKKVIGSVGKGVSAGGKKTKDVVVAAGKKIKSTASSAANSLKDLSKPPTDLSSLGPIRVKDVDFRGNEIVKKSTPERQTFQGGAVSPTQEVLYRNSLIRQTPLRESDVISIAESYNLKIAEKTAKKVVSVYESLNEDNKEHLKELLTKDIDTFKRVIEFTDKVNQ